MMRRELGGHDEMATVEVSSIGEVLPVTPIVSSQGQHPLVSKDARLLQGHDAQAAEHTAQDSAGLATSSGGQSSSTLLSRLSRDTALLDAAAVGLGLNLTSWSESDRHELIEFMQSQRRGTGPTLGSQAATWLTSSKGSDYFVGFSSLMQATGHTLGALSSGQSFPTAAVLTNVIGMATSLIPNPLFAASAGLFINFYAGIFSNNNAQIQLTEAILKSVETMISRAELYQQMTNLRDGFTSLSSELNWVPALFGGYSEADGAWTAVSGPCTIAGHCVQSSNYPLNYNNQESCHISVNPSKAGPIVVETFATENRFDVLLVNGNPYSGSTSPTGVSPTGDITWSSDFSVTGAGWKLCSQTSVAEADKDQFGKAWVAGELAKKSEAMYFIMLQNELALKRRMAFHTDCVAYTLEQAGVKSDACLKWRTSGNIILGLQHAELHLQVLINIIRVEPSYTAPILSKMKELAEEYEALLCAASEDQTAWEKPLVDSGIQCLPRCCDEAIRGQCGARYCPQWREAQCPGADACACGGGCCSPEPNALALESRKIRKAICELTNAWKHAYGSGPFLQCDLHVTGFTIDGRLVYPNCYR